MASSKRPARRGKKKRGAAAKRWLLLLLLVVAVGAAGAAYVSPWFKGSPRPAGAKPVEVTVSSGDSLATAAAKLEKAKVIGSADRFLTLARFLGSDGPIKAGEYGFYPTDNWAAHLRTMQSGIPILRLVSIPEGMPAVLVQERLMAEPLLTGTVAVPAEGSVLPDSYSFERGETRAAVLRRMQAAMTRALDDLWKTRKPGIAVKTPREAIILASIVEKETSVAAERRTVAAVYSNRIKRNMPLQADPTVIYPVTKGRRLGRRILRSELQADNGYNTYRIPGLPAGPIANPGRASIAAVLDPARTNALYFVADGSGGHAFAETLDQHNANVRKWYALRRERGEM
ncbi:endolytic transglycosylase MltG [Sphingomonas sanxanigenens]|uniref:Endolytic murein transglycosylase n=1 Tax=Sphingomonas sanxanigenens DSM 19645 = NX02 TaxID=1123269 RepID=W0ABZ7_9SPHN|nr:endolytic transglycosylase MltG [Sphingomonas sanxanigenens]AHE54027.1 hypothetical protein NX02_11585 [Sphingomonas sanxanigenens DSM 19645 = NX02]